MTVVYDVRQPIDPGVVALRTDEPNGLLGTHGPPSEAFEG